VQWVFSFSSFLWWIFVMDSRNWIWELICEDNTLILMMLRALCYRLWWLHLATATGDCHNASLRARQHWILISIPVRDEIVFRGIRLVLLLCFILTNGVRKLQFILLNRRTVIAWLSRIGIHGPHVVTHMTVSIVRCLHAGVKLCVHILAQ